MHMPIATNCNRLLAAVTAALLFAATGTANARFYRSEEIRPLWIKMDLDGDGYVSAVEVRAQEPRLLRAFRKADHDRDGRLDLREFEVLLISL
jgi:Ca2+-binding EF-hand superfamily protein